ncbi:hypothetical protein ACFE04_008906 [Oxalis oulophora]
MDLLHIRRTVLTCLIIASLICYVAAKVEATTTGSVYFIDSTNQRYFRVPSSNHETESMSISEVGGAISVLLGFAPPSTLSAAGSSKLNELLVPNPFDKPRAVFSLEVTGVDDSDLLGHSFFNNGMKRDVILGSDKSDIQLPGKDEVSVISLDEPVVEFTNKELSDLASWLDGSYNADAAEPVLTLPLANDNNLDLYMSKDVDRKFAASIISLVRNIRNAMAMHEDLSQSVEGPAELVMGSFEGIKSLREQYGTEAAQKGLELLIAALSKAFDSLQAAYKGQIVGVVLCNRSSQEESGKMLSVTLASRPSPRWLAEKTTSPEAAIVEVILVRRTLAWLTGIILLIATILGAFEDIAIWVNSERLCYLAGCSA